MHRREKLRERGEREIEQTHIEKGEEHCQEGSRIRESLCDLETEIMDLAVCKLIRLDNWLDCPLEDVFFDVIR